MSGHGAGILGVSVSPVRYEYITNRTLLYYPLTACFGRRNLPHRRLPILNAVANCLANMGSTSQAIFTMQNLFQQFVVLARCFSIGFLEVAGADKERVVGTMLTASSPVLHRGWLLMLPAWGSLRRGLLGWMGYAIRCCLVEYYNIRCFVYLRRFGDSRILVVN